MTGFWLMTAVFQTLHMLATGQHGIADRANSSRRCSAIEAGVASIRLTSHTSRRCLTACG
ncbi:hypothetical protein XACJK48_530018 [Xanthomonas citri pv. citri]|nr:hypothetical protein XACJK48_530018 [Xanthomonas citri pv. citri]CEH64787.1 hypothetical protein XAC3610_620018 [Xanthomonas citri pv. citri]CEH67112.1 hypothetical protein XACLD7_700017 [Xanthomonas citri pv. citri]CEH77500.1 hypothetical protein XACS582_770018 [Xanthomonas citri pv. citri]CEL44805.1 hypothetical protein XAC439_560017 [Xanthomonas citri pv. citri]